MLYFLFISFLVSAGKSEYLKGYLSILGYLSHTPTNAHVFISVNEDFGKRSLFGNVEKCSKNGFVNSFVQNLMPAESSGGFFNLFVKRKYLI